MKIAPIGILCGRVRLEEKVIFEAFRARSTSFDRLDEDSLRLPIGKPWTGPGVVLDRSIHHGRSLYTLSLLNALPQDHGLEEIGVTGYPESHPFIHDDMTIQAMWDKRRFATYIVSNMSFDPDTVKRWVERVRNRGVELPIYVGMAGVADPARLLRLSTKIGITESARFLRGHPSWVARMFRPGGYEPGRFLAALMRDIALPERRVAGLHVFTFNEIEPTERWRREMLSRL